jgi:DNA-binding transcriptional LysR family regulator
MALDIVACMRVFTAVVEADSFAGAAARLELSRGMASRNVAQLETHLGVRLLHRTTRRLSLTGAGHDYYPRAVQILAMIEEAGAAVAQEALAPRGTLRVTAPSVFGTRHLDHAIAEFVQRHPGVEVDLALSERMVDLVDEGFDLAIRVATEVAPGLVARRLAPVRMALCAAPAYLEQHGRPRTPAGLADHNCLCYTQASDRNDWQFRRGGEQRSVRVTGNLRCNNGEVLLNAACAGLGVIFEPTFLVHAALRERRLQRLLPEWQGEDYAMFAVYPNRRHLPLKVRSFIDFLVERFGPEPYWDEA